MIKTFTVVHIMPRYLLIFYWFLWRSGNKKDPHFIKRKFYFTYSLMKQCFLSVFPVEALLQTIRKYIITFLCIIIYNVTINPTFSNIKYHIAIHINTTQIDDCIFFNENPSRFFLKNFARFFSTIDIFRPERTLRFLKL